MTDDPANDCGVFASARRLSGSVLAVIRSRLELFTIELQEEKLRAGKLLLWVAVAVILVGAALLLAVGTLALFLWQMFGFGGLVGLIAVLTAMATLVVILIRRWIVSGPQPFSATVAEIQKDIECLRDR